MSQPKSITEAALDEFKQAGIPVEKGRRSYFSKRMTGWNAEVYSGWIERWVRNAATNFQIARNAAGIPLLKNSAKDVPAVVVGIGPSLDDELQALKLAPRHAVILATDAALRPLLRHGIKPDLVINYDAKDEQRSMWNSIDTSDLVLLASSCTSPLTLDAWKGKKMLFNMQQGDDEFASNILPALFPFIGGLPNLGTVGNGAVFLAHEMGCKPIIGVGMDLCYRKDGEIWKYRCADYIFRTMPGEPDEWIPTENKILYDNDQRMARTFDEEIKGVTYRIDECLKYYRNSLVGTIGQFDIPFINCSRGGVLSDMLPTMTLQKAIEDKCYRALEPGRTVVKHLAKLVDDPLDGWHLCEKNKIFIRKFEETNPAPYPKR